MNRDQEIIINEIIKAKNEQKKYNGLSYVETYDLGIVIEKIDEQADIIKILSDYINNSLWNAQDLLEENKKLRNLLERFINRIENRRPQTFLLTVLSYFIKDAKRILKGDIEK